MTAPRVSVLMTCYNREPYLAAAIESVLAQTFTDFELIIVDDGSVDASLVIARKYAAIDSRVRVHANARNLGDYANRNHAASLARGEYLRYADSDDIQYPHCLAVLVPMLDAAPTAAFALGGSRAWPGAPVPMLLSPRQAFQREFLGGGLFHIGPGGALIRRSVFVEAGGFTTDSIMADGRYWMKLAAHYPMLLTPADLFWYRTHDGQELQRPAAIADAARFVGERWAALHSDSCPLSPEERVQAMRNLAGLSARDILRDVLHGRWSLAMMRLRNSGPRGVDWLRYARRPIRSIDAGTPAADPAPGDA